MEWRREFRLSALLAQQRSRYFLHLAQAQTRGAATALGDLHPENAHKAIRVMDITIRLAALRIYYKLVVMHNICRLPYLVIPNVGYYFLLWSTLKQTLTRFLASPLMKSCTTI
jgi:hypothetical protein